MGTVEKIRGFGFDLASAQKCAQEGKTEEWIHRYLTTGEWANQALSDGLKLQKRWWTGPIEVHLADLRRAVGPEEGMEFKVEPAKWKARIGEVAKTLKDPPSIPPLIAEYRKGFLSIRDGNTRLGAMESLKWKKCWVFVWYNTESDYIQHDALLSLFNGPLKLPQDTQRLTFRPLTLNDADNLLVIFSDPIAMKHYPSTKTIKETRGWINWCTESYERHGHGLWAVSLKESGVFVGQCGIMHHTMRGFVDKEIGYLFQRRHWHNGYATEAAAACRDFAFTVMGLPKAVSFIDPANTPSSNVAKRIGMSLECVLQPEQNRWKKVVHVYSVARS